MADKVMRGPRRTDSSSAQVEITKQGAAAGTVCNGTKYRIIVSFGGPHLFLNRSATPVPAID